MPDLASILEAVRVWHALPVWPGALPDSVTNATALFWPIITLALVITTWNLATTSDVHDATTRSDRFNNRPMSGATILSQGNLYRERWRVLRLLAWFVLVFAIVVEWRYRSLLFTYVLLFYAATELHNSLSDRYTWMRWNRLDERRELDRAARVETVLVENQEALRENTALTKVAIEKTEEVSAKTDLVAEKAESAYQEANTVNAKIESLGHELSADRRQERLERELPGHEPLQAPPPRLGPSPQGAQGADG